MTRMLIVGGLTIDRFVDGSVAPGGSVLHSGLAAVAEGAQLSTLTVAGDEPAARDGLERLAGLGELVRRPSPSTTVYRHEEREGARVLLLEARSEQIGAGPVDGISPPAVALVAPIADEVDPGLVDALRTELAPGLVVLLIQGWLRHLVVGEEVRPLPLVTLSVEQLRVIAAADAVVVSTEDLTESPGEPFAQAAALRRRLGPSPILVLTLGTEGYLLDDPAQERVIASVPRRVVGGVSANGAGDTFGAALAVHLGRGADPRTAADLATDRVIAMLEARWAAGAVGRIEGPQA